MFCKGPELSDVGSYFCASFGKHHFFLSPVKRAITAKTMHTADFVLWGMWGDKVKQDGGKNLNQIGEAKTVTKQEQPGTTVSESAGIITTTAGYTTDTTSDYSSY